MKITLHVYLLSGALLSLCGCLGTAESDRRPNILFAISDDQSFPHTSFAGCPFIRTPAFDRVASEGIYFANCTAGSPGCAPSRSSIVTGRYHWQNEQSGQHASSWMKRYVPFVDALEANGYEVGRTGKGVDPFQYARGGKDTLWRITNAAGIEHSNIGYDPGSSGDDRFAKGIARVNYFENFRHFMEKRDGNKPFFFWYGGREPHRGYEKDSWIRRGKQLDQVEVPGFLPDSDTIRGDLLDYAVEIEWFDLHLLRMLEYLESIGELDNTLVMVTSDNGMPFPRAKANCYEYGIHVPLAVRYPKQFPGGRMVDDPVGFADIAPTLLELTGSKPVGMQPMSGRSFLNVLKSDGSGLVDSSRKYTLAGRERHSSSRWKNLGYPQRAIRTDRYLFIWNMRPERWPAGSPRRSDPGNPGELLPMFGLDHEGKHHSEWAFTDVDASPSKSFLVENQSDTCISDFFRLSYAKRPEFELYDIQQDPFCLQDLSGSPSYDSVQRELFSTLSGELKGSNDPRMVGPDKEVFETYERYSPIREFPKPDWAE